MRVAKATQKALDELDWPCAASEISSRFMQKVRAALGALPGLCFDSVERVATALATNNHKAEIPTGYGAACVRHFSKRNGQLETVLRGSVESRFALIEVSSLASIAGQWGASPPRVTSASHKECLSQVARLPCAHAGESERWRAVIQFLRDREDAGPGFLRNIACALVWCGYFSPVERESGVSSAASDAWIAQHFFGIPRASFVRSRIEVLHWLPQLREIMVQSSTGGAP
jgi:hypothetical protein